MPKLERDSDGYCVCPLCGLRTFVVWSYTIPLGGPYDPNRMDAAVASSWVVECDGGHRVDGSGGAGDYAEPVRLDPQEDNPCRTT